MRRPKVEMGGNLGTEVGVHIHDSLVALIRSDLATSHQ